MYFVKKECCYLIRNMWFGWFGWFWWLSWRFGFIICIWIRLVVGIFLEYSLFFDIFLYYNKDF